MKGGRARRGVLAAAIVIAAVGGTGVGHGDSQTTSTLPITIAGAGSWGPHSILVQWQDALYGASDPHPIDLQYLSNGSFLGRQNLLDGTSDFAISGVPFTADELARIPNGADGVIAAPIQVTANAYVLSYPFGGFVNVKQVCDPDANPDLDCIVRTPYTGPIRIPNANLAAMLFSTNDKCAGDPTKSLFAKSWLCPDVLKAMGVDQFDLAPSVYATPVARSDPSASNYYFQQWVKTVAPDVWTTEKSSDSKLAWEPITERLPRIPRLSREGAEQQAFQLGLVGSAIGNIGASQGTIAPVPPWAKAAVNAAFPDTKVDFIQVQNANGDWVAPTPDTLSAAVAAGGDAPLYAATNKVSNAYPAAWVDKMYVRASGLSIDKTEAIATAIRYIVTTGQDVEAAHGDGRLSNALVKDALAAADKIVQSNCTGSDRVVVKSADPGPLAPVAPALKAIGSMLHCQAAATPTTTTAAVASTATTAATAAMPAASTVPSSTVAVSDSTATATTATPALTAPSASYVSGLSTSALTSIVTAATAPLAAANGSVASVEPGRGSIPVRLVNGILTASDLPFAIPGTGTGADVITTMMLGALLFMVVFRFARRAMQGIRR